MFHRNILLVMKKKIINQFALLKYKGHIIRKVEDEFGCINVLIDNPYDYIEMDLNIAPPCHYTYASIEDAKRFINGKPLKYIPEEAEICGDKFWNRFL